MGDLDPTVKATLIAQGSNLSDGDASTLLEVVDQSQYGSKQRWMRMGIGAAIGLGVGFLLAKAKR